MQISFYLNAVLRLNPLPAHESKKYAEFFKIIRLKIRRIINFFRTRQQTLSFEKSFRLPVKQRSYSAYHRIISELTFNFFANHLYDKKNVSCFALSRDKLQLSEGFSRAALRVLYLR